MKTLAIAVTLVLVLTACSVAINSTLNSEGSTSTETNDIDERKQTNLGRAPAKEMDQ